jgi:hypothetical protein
MGRKPIGRKPMTDAERSARRYAHVASKPRLARIKRMFLQLLETDKAAFLDWLKRQHFI